VEEGNPRRVLDPDKTLRSLVVIIHEKAINQFSGMAYFGGVFNGGEVSVRAIDIIPEYPYPVRASVDVVGFLEIEGIFSILSGVFDPIMHWIVFWSLVFKAV
jgi:hypothetical protein